VQDWLIGQNTFHYTKLNYIIRQIYKLDQIILYNVKLARLYEAAYKLSKLSTLYN